MRPRCRGFDSRPRYGEVRQEVARLKVERHGGNQSERGREMGTRLSVAATQNARVDD